MNRRRNGNTKRIDASEVVLRSKSEVLIDGYNLMHVTRFKPVHQDEHELRRCREGLLTLLVKLMPPQRYRGVHIVFDAQHALRALPAYLRWRHLEVTFARDENSADDQIAKMIESHHHPQHLVVVSSDHRVQVAAKRRRATAIDSDDWFDAILDMPTPVAETKSEAEDDGLSESELADFKRAMLNDTKSRPAEVENPFPPGHFDDLEDLE